MLHTQHDGDIWLVCGVLLLLLSCSNMVTVKETRNALPSLQRVLAQSRCGSLNASERHFGAVSCQYTLQWSVTQIAVRVLLNITCCLHCEARGTVASAVTMLVS
jgi:hypothetical protein